jgi:MYXO-CTERM domain-containing protein
MRSLVIVLSLGAGLTLLARPARADIPPDPDSADAHCTLAEQCASGTFCEYAFNPGDKTGEMEKVGLECRKEAEKKGLERRCRNGGNYSGDTLYCPPGATGTWSAGGGSPAPEPTPTPAPTPPVAATPTPTPAPATPPAPGKASSGCSVRGEATGAPLLLVLTLLGLRSRRRR